VDLFSNHKILIQRRILYQLFSKLSVFEFSEGKVYTIITIHTLNTIDTHMGTDEVDEFRVIHR